MATITEMRDALFAWIDGQTTLTVIWHFPNAPMPAPPFVSMRMRPLANIGQDYHGPADDSGIADIFKDREFLVDVQVYGELHPRGAHLAQSECEKIKRSLQTRAVVDTLDAAGLASLEALPTEDVSAVGVEFEARYMFQARFGVTMQDTEDVGLIATSDAPTGSYES